MQLVKEEIVNRLPVPKKDNFIPVNAIEEEKSEDSFASDSDSSDTDSEN